MTASPTPSAAVSPALQADLVVVLHFAYVQFVVLGQLLIVIGWLRRWNWVRNFWFRLAHFIAIGLVALEALMEIECPLTTWEKSLRLQAGQPVNQASFIGRMMHNVLFVDCPESAFTWLHVGFALLVAATLFLVPPRIPRRRRGES